MKETITSRTGSAPIKRTGHTTDGRHGSDPNAKVRGGGSSRDIKR